MKALFKASPVLLTLSSPTSSRAQSESEEAKIRAPAARWERAWNPTT
jgi:hypothetical protein